MSRRAAAPAGQPGIKIRSMCEEQTTPTDTQSLDEKVAAWVTASGRGTEMATARAARDAGAVAIQSVPFVDPVTGKDREVDVLAEFEESAGPPCPDGEPTVRQVDYARVRTPGTGNAVLVHVMGLERFRSFARQVADLQTRNDPAWGPGHTPSWRDLPPGTSI